jgi:hypothetical protein
MNRMIEDTTSTPTHVPILLDGSLRMHYITCNIVHV